MGKSGRKGERGGERARGRGDEVFPPSAELVVERVRRELCQPGLFIGWLGRCPGGEIFLVAILIQHAGMPLTLSGHTPWLALAHAHAGVPWRLL